MTEQGHSRGFAYLLALLIAALVTGAVLVVIEETGIESSMVHNKEEALRAEWLARAAVHHGVWELRSDTDFRSYVRDSSVVFPRSAALDVGEYEYRIFPDGLRDLVVEGWGGRGSAGNTSHQRVSEATFTRSAVVSCEKDCMISEFEPDLNYGGSPKLSLRVKPAYRRRLLLWFRVDLPKNAQVMGATLELSMVSARDRDQVELTVHPLFVTWDEGNGDGDPGRANWMRRKAANYWTTPGGDGDYGPSLPTVVPLSLSTGTYRWDVTSVVAAWNRGVLTNNGLMVIGVESEFDPSMGEGPERVFASREEPDTSLHPVLIIRYAIGAEGTSH